MRNRRRGREGEGEGEGADKRERRESARREEEGKERSENYKNDLLQGSLIKVVCQWKVFATCTDVTL